MTPFIQSSSGVLVPSKAVHVARCGYCPRLIIKEREIKQRYHVFNNKPMCMVCRATKLKPYEGHIRSQERELKKDMRARQEQIEKNENDRVEKLALESQRIINPEHED